MNEVTLYIATRGKKRPENTVHRIKCPKTYYFLYFLADQPFNHELYLTARYSFHMLKAQLNPNQPSHHNFKYTIHNLKRLIY